MIKENVLKDFSTWDLERQLSELQSYKNMGEFSPLNEMDYELMQTIIENRNKEILIECEDGVCEVNFCDEIVNEGTNTEDINQYKPKTYTVTKLKELLNK